MTASTPHIITVPVRYHEDASGLFAHVGGTAATDTLLLESADITTRSGVNSLAVLSASLRVTCTGRTVTVEPLTESGVIFAADLAERLDDYVVGENTYEFPVSTKIDERERLTDVSSVAVLRALTTEAAYRSENDALPMLVGGIAYDYLETFEELPVVEPSANTYPDYQFLLAEIVLSIDHQTATARLDAVDAVDGGSGVAEKVRALAETIETVESADFDKHVSVDKHDGVLPVTADIPDEEFRAQVENLKGNIYNGDIYQVVPARTFTAECPDAFAAYRRLREINPSPYMFYTRGLDLNGEVYELFGASPESNLKFDAETRQIEMYPIAGTRPRGMNADGSIDDELDIRMELELRTDAKEIAEHTMLVDLARNDLARVAVPGTRRVADLLQVDRYSRVMHLVSRVTAELHPDLDAMDAYRACMNMGTLTGAPKLKAMALLRGVEKRRRGSYGGAIGYLKGTGDMDTCIVIRSAYVSGGVAAVQAGAGVVRDSNPQAEADETLHKAYAALNAIALAQGKDLKVVR